MSLYNKNHLRFSYNWNTPEADSNAVEGFPEDKELNRQEGYEVLCFINKYMQYRNFKLLTTFQKLEDLIRVHLLVTTKSHAQIRDWLDSHHVF